MGKWAKFRDQFKELPYDEALELAVAALEADGTYETLSAAVATLDAAKKQAAETEKAIGFAKEAAEIALLRKMKDAGLESIKVGNVRWTRSEAPFPTVADREALRQWALEHMPENLTLHSSTLRGIVSRAIEQNEPIPEGVTVFFKPGLHRSTSQR